jgi:hypothetical protein
VLKAATVNGARAAGLEREIGTLTPGKQADIIMVRTNGVGVFPVTNAIGTIVQAVERSDVDTVMVAGAIRKRAGKLVGVDVAKLTADVTARATTCSRRAAIVRTSSAHPPRSSLNRIAWRLSCQHYCNGCECSRAGSPSRPAPGIIAALFCGYLAVGLPLPVIRCSSTTSWASAI